MPHCGFCVQIQDHDFALYACSKLHTSISIPPGYWRDALQLQGVNGRIYVMRGFSIRVQTTFWYTMDHQCLQKACDLGNTSIWESQSNPSNAARPKCPIILLPAFYPRKSNWSHFPSSVANSCGISCAWSKALTIQAISTLSTTKFELCTFLFASVLLSTIRRLGCQMGHMLQVIAGNIVEYRANQIIS